MHSEIPNIFCIYPHHSVAGGEEEGEGRQHCCGSLQPHEVPPLHRDLEEGGDRGLVKVFEEQGKRKGSRSSPTLSTWRSGSSPTLPTRRWTLRSSSSSSPPSRLKILSSSNSEALICCDLLGSSHRRMNK